MVYPQLQTSAHHQDGNTAFSSPELQHITSSIIVIDFMARVTRVCKQELSTNGTEYKVVVKVFINIRYAELLWQESSVESFKGIAAVGL